MKKKTITLLLATLLLSSLFAQKQPTIARDSSTQDNIRLKIIDNAVTVKNLNPYTVTITLHNTTEKELTLKAGKEVTVHMDADAKYLEAQINGSKCSCWVKLFTYCGAMPIVWSNVNFTWPDENTMQVTFSAYNTPPYDNTTSFWACYKMKGEDFFRWIKLDVPTITGISQNFVRTFKIK